jgi:glycosyltransferase involved in cell wall biosynthesis
VSDAVKALLEKETQRNIPVVVNGILYSAIRRKSFEEPQTEKKRIVLVGRLLASCKGQDLLLEALGILKQKGMENISVDFIGDGESIRQLEELTKKLNISRNVNFLGTKKQSYIYENLCHYDLAVQPSRYEAFGLSLAEAMAACVPILASDIPAFMQITENGVYGNLFVSGNANDFAEKIRHILKKSSNTRHLEKASEWIKERYSIENTANRYLEIYQKIKEQA